MIASNAKINVFGIFFHSTGPFGVARFEIAYLKLIIAFEANNVAIPTLHFFSHFSQLCNVYNSVKLHLADLRMCLI